MEHRRTDLQKNKVLLGLSGGVDSTAAALFLREKGFEVTGFFFDVLGNQEDLRERAAKAASDIGIDFISADVSEEFNEKIIGYFCDAYLNGKTPNPCAMCNPRMKFRYMLETADRIGAYHLATGHYARTWLDPENGRTLIRRAENEKKDQSYMLYRLGQDILSRVLFPLGEIDSKEDTRAYVRDEGLFNADLKDSQEICFVKDEDYISYLTRNGCHETPGNFIDHKGKVLGQHKGIIHYTIGQRKGLGITFGKPVFVTNIDVKTNTVTLGDHEDLFQSTVIAEDLRFSLTNDVTGEVPSVFPMEYSKKKITAKIRYAARPAEAVLEQGLDGTARIEFAEPQRAATPGQAIVFYDGELLIGGGVIV